MCNRFGACVMALFALAVSGCGGVDSMVVVPPDHLATFDRIRLLEPVVTSREQESEDIAMNVKLQKQAADELRSMLADKKIAPSPDAPMTLECRIEVVYGSRALRYWSDGGAGTGYIRTLIQLKEADGTVRYATKSEAKLAVGVLGGSMEKVAGNTIQESVEDFGLRL